MHKAVTGLLEEPDLTDPVTHKVGNANEKEVGSASVEIQLSIPRYFRLGPTILYMVQNLGRKLGLNFTQLSQFN